MYDPDCPELKKQPLYFRLEKELLTDMSNLKHPKSIILLLFLIRNGHFKDNQTELIEKTVKQTTKIFTQTNSQSHNKTLVILWFAYLGVYEKELFDVFKRDSKIFKKLENGQYELENKLLHSNPLNEGPNASKHRFMRYSLKVIGKLHENFFRKKALVKYQSQSEVI